MVHWSGEMKHFIIAIIAVLSVLHREQLLTEAVGCPRRYLRRINGKCYYFSVKKMNWFGALNNCLRKGLTLADLSNPRDFNGAIDFLSSKGNTEDFWFGGNDLQTEGRFQYVSNGRLVRYFGNYSIVEPAEHSECDDCLEVRIRNNLTVVADDNCLERQYFICSERYCEYGGPGKPRHHSHEHLHHFHHDIGEPSEEAEAEAVDNTPLPIPTDQEPSGSVEAEQAAIPPDELVPAEGGEAPAEGGEGPAEGGEAPGEGGEAPAEGGEAPGDGGEAPAEGGEAPAEGGEAPAEGGETPAEGGEAPAEGGEAPAEGGEKPAEGGEAPAEGGEAPAEGGEAPAEGGEAPAEGGEAPAEGGEAPAEGGGAPAEGGEAPAEGGEAPAEGAAAPPETDTGTDVETEDPFTTVTASTLATKKADGAEEETPAAEGGETPAEGGAAPPEGEEAPAAPTE